MTTMTMEDIANLSDEDMEKMEYPPTAAPEPEPKPDEVNTDEAAKSPEGEGDVTTTVADDVPVQGEDDGDESDPDKPVVDPAVVGDPTDGATAPVDNAAGDPPAAKDKGDGEDKPNGDSADAPADVDYKALTEALYAPFRANGKDMQVDNIDDARSLMSMGANYNKKMAALKPNLKMLKMLDNNGLLDENKLSYLIDLDKKDPKAIAKLIKDSEYDVAAEQDTTDYTPNTYTVGDKEVDLDSAFADIRNTDSYATTTDIIGNKWDDASRGIIADNPELIGVINGQVADGTYDKITAEVDKQRALGKLNGVSDIQAYKEVGTTMLSKAPAEDTPAAPQAPAKAPASVKGKPTPQPTRPRASAKQAAATTKPGKAKSGKQLFNPLDMSDEEMEKMDMPNFL